MVLRAAVRTTIVAQSCRLVTLSPRGTSGERAGERGISILTFIAKRLLSPALSSALRKRGSNPSGICASRVTIINPGNCLSILNFVRLAFPFRKNFQRFVAAQLFRGNFAA